MREEIWKDVVGYEGVYQVSDMGRLKRLARCGVRIDGKRYNLKERITYGYKENWSDGYMGIKLCKDGKCESRKLHRVIAITFMPLDDYSGMEVNHIDYDRTNNKLENLEWVTHKENVRHSSDDGRYKDNTRGIRNGRAKYTEEEIIHIRNLYDSGKTVMQIIQILFPELDYKDRKNKWSRIKEICQRITYSNIN